MWVSVSTSTVLAGTGAVILAFRDVTAERALEHELRSTKEFLERLIDSTVDAIIAADMRGSIILFNQGAERLFGYRARDVIGKLPVWELYEEGGANQIMRMLRSTSYGGVGRLEQTRREVRIASGEIVPVSMTASVVYEGEREAATVGILTDLRERIRMEQRLLDAQQKLQLSEKQALVAELAGAAAHELNQPLTSIMGYTQLIQRQSEKDASHLRAVGIILSEAERMAGIVKKIGKITKYETVDYVGTAKMLDLNAAAASDPAIPIVTADESQTGDLNYRLLLTGWSGRALWRVNIPAAGAYGMICNNHNFMSDADIPADDRVVFLKQPDSFKEVKTVRTIIQVTGATITMTAVILFYLLHSLTLQKRRKQAAAVVD